MTFACTPLDTPIGPMLAASDGRALTGLWFEHQRHFPTTAAAWARRDELPLFGALRAVLAAYFADDMPDDALASVPLAPAGTSFQKRVWDALRAIPYGATCAYAELARRVEVPQAARAVGAAVGRNPISILIPCHRVVGSDGALTGYAGGLDRKRALLALERRPRVRLGPSVTDARNDRADIESGPVAAPR